jgi:TPR repeat protein
VRELLRNPASFLAVARFVAAEPDSVDAEAVWALRHAAEQGDAAGQVNLGVCYADGRGGLRKGEVEAVRLYRLAAERGDAEGLSRSKALSQLWRNVDGLLRLALRFAGRGGRS